MRTLLPIAIGAVLGAWSRHGLGLALNRLNPSLPWGTLAANLLGGLLIGMALGWQATRGLSEPLRLALVTGFLGALTTFSTFSAESLGLLLQARVGAALLHTAVHLAGSLLAAWCGWRFVQAL